MRYIIRKSALISFTFLTALAFGCAAGSDPDKGNIQEPKTAPGPPPISDKPKIIAFGDSLTGGYGLENWQDSYPALLQHSIDAAGYDYQVLNYGSGGDTSAGGLKRVALVLEFKNTAVFILALGANDVVKKVPADQIKPNLSEIIRRVKEKNSRVLLCGIGTPAEYGDAYSDEIRNMYETLAREMEVPLLPTLMKDVAGVPDKLLPDGIHPNAEGAKIIEKNVLAALLPLLERDDTKRKK